MDKLKNTTHLAVMLAGILLTIVGSNADSFFASNPDLAAVISWPAGLSGMLLAIGSFVTKQAQMQTAVNDAKGDIPPSPNGASGTPIPAAQHLTNLAINESLTAGDVERARRLTDAYYGYPSPNTTKTPKFDPADMPGKGVA